MRATTFPYNLPWLLRLAWAHRGVLGIASHLTASERAVLYRLAYHFGGDGVLEIGSYLGASGAALAAGLADRNGTARLVCVDTWLNDTMSEGARDTWAAFHHNTARYRARIDAVRGLSAESAPAVADRLQQPLSLAFFDGDHSPEGVRRDWEAYRPLLGPGAVVAFHDVGWAEGVQRLVAESIAPRAEWSQQLPNLYWARLRHEH